MTRESHVKQPQGNKARRSSAAQQAQWRFQADLLDQLPDPVIAVDQDERITYLNRAAVAQYGVDPVGAIGQPLHYVHRYEWLQPEDELLAEAALAQQGHWRGENRHICQDGSALQVESLVTLLHDETGNRTGMVAVIRDMTDRKQAEHTLRANELRYRRLADTMPQLIWTADRNGDVNYYNIHIHDFDPSVWQGVTGFDWTSMIHPDDLAPTLATWQQAVTQRRPYTCEHRLHMADGSWRWHLSRAMLVQDPDQDLKWYGTATDIHERRLAEEQLKFHAGLLDYAYDAVIATDADLNVTAWNRGAEEMYGWSAAEVLGRKPHEVLRSTMTPVARVEAVRQMAESGRFCVESTTYHRDGTPILVEGHSVAMCNDNGQITGYMSISRDIRGRKAAEEALRISEERYRTLFVTMDEGFCVFEMIYTETGEPIDYRFLEANPAFARFTGLENAVGKTAYELVPNLEAKWVAIYAEVAHTGAARHFIEGSAAMGRWFEVHAFRFGGPESRRVALLFTNITERKLIEDALRDSEEDLRYTVELNPQAPWTADPAGNITSFNQRWLDLTGMSEEEALGSGWMQAPHPADLPAMVAAWTHAIQSGEPYDIEQRIRLADGSYRWMRSRAFPRRTTAGEIVRWYGATEDIHDRKVVEDQLRQSEASFRILADAAPVLVWVCTPDGNNIYMNARWHEFTGQSQADAAGYGWATAMHPADTATILPYWERCRATGETYTGKVRYRRHDGEYHWHIFRALPRRNDEGKIEAWYGCSLDISAQKEAEDALRENETWLQTILQNIPVSVYLLTPDQRYLYVNRHYEKLAGITNAEIQGKAIGDMFDPETAVALAANDQRALAAKAPLYLEEFAPQNGVIHTYSSIKTPLLNAAGEPYAVLGISTDITERKLAEEALRASEALLAAELADAKQLQQISSQMIQEENIQALYQQILAAALAMMGAEMGSMQMLNPENDLLLLAWQGFDPAAADFWTRVRVDSASTCGMALQTRARVLVADVESCAFMAGTADLAFYRLSGIRAVQSTPLVSRSGRIVGMISTHWRNPHQPADRDWRRLDVLARQAADLIERKLAEEALRASEERLRLATEAGSVGIFDHDLIANQTEVSPIYRQITGLAPDAVVTRESWLALVHPEDRPLVTAIWQEAQSTSTAYYYECRLLRPDGALAWIEVNAWVTRDETGRGVRITGAVRDITERKQTALHQQFLLDLNSTLRTLSDATAIQQTVVERLGQYLGADRCRFNAVDLSADKSTLLAVWSRPGLPPPTDINPLSTLAPAAYISSAQAGRTLVIENAHQDEQNEIIKALMLAHGFVATIRVPCLREGVWVASLHVLQTTPRQWRADEVGLVESVVHHFWPLAEKARSEKELRWQEGFLRQLADNVPGLVGYLDAGERYRFVNATFEEWFQRPRQQILGYTVAEIIGKADSRPLAAYRQQALAGAKVRYETDFTYPDGITRTIWGRYQPDLTADGRVLGFYLFLMDITERKQMEEALHASEARFRAVQQASPDGYMIFESVRNEQGVIIDFRWLYVNPASEQMIGRRAQDLLGNRLLEEMPGNRETGLFDAYVQVVETGEVYQREFCYQHEGIDRWFRNTAAKAGDGFAVAFSDITARKQAEIALQQSNAILQGVLECSNDAIFVRDLTGRYLLVNEAGAAQVRLPKNAILGRRYQDLFTAAEVAAIREDDHAVLGQGRTVTVEHVVTQESALRYWHTLKMPLRDANGAIIGLISSARDLTERKAAEEALRLSEARYRTIFENAGVSLWEEDFSLVKQAVDAMVADWRAAGITDLGAAMHDHCAAHPAFVRAMLERVRILDVNEETVRLYGRPKTELLRPFAQHFTDETLTHFVNQLVLIARHGQRYTFDGPIETPQGETRHVAFTLVFPTEAESDFTRVLLSGLDITTLKEAEMALRSSEARFRHLAEAMPQIVWTCQADGSMTYINQQWQQYSGLPTATTLAEGMWPAIHPDDQAANRELWRCALDNGEAYEGEVRLRRHNGAYCWFLERAIPVRDDADVITQWFGVSMDIDERKRHERHQQFLSDLGMDLRLLSDSATILTQLVKRLGDYLHVAGCRVNEVDLVQGQFTLQQDWVAADAPWPPTTTPGVYPLADLAAPLLLAALQAGQTVVVANTLSDPRTAPVAANYAQDQVHSLIGVPIFHQGQWRATLSVKEDGERQWRADEVALVESVAGQLSALLEKVRAEEALRASEERLRLALAGGGLGIWESQIATNRSLWSPEEYALFGLPLGVEITSELFNQLVHPADLPGLQVAMQRLFSSGKEHVGEFRIIRPDGAVCWLADRVTVLRDEAGQPERLLGINFEITERKAREAMIRQQLAEIEAIYATAPIGLCLVDCDLRYVRINETLATINGGAIADYLGRTLAETMSVEGYRLVEPLYRHVIETGLPLLHQEVDESYVDPVQARDWLANYYPLKNAEGVVIGVNAVILEITDRKRHERQLQELNRQLQESNATLEERVRERTKALEEANRALSTINRELEQFTYAAAHDLRTPLRGIANLVQWISEDAAPVIPPASQRHLEQLGGRVKRLEKMLEDLLLYSRVGRVRYQPEDVDVQQLLCGLLDLLAPPVGFVIKLSPQLPTFTTLRIPLEMVFRNLLSNAMRHHHEPARGQVEITVRDLDEWYEFQVSDNGPGIASQYHDRIFGMFQTLRPRDQVEGSGIGLALVKKTMENIGGRIWMESVIEQGTTFYFTWPKEQKAEE